MPPSLVETMGTLEDFRVDRTRLYSLTDILVLSVLAVICGADSFVAIVLFGQFNEEWLRTFLELPNGIPSHNTLGRVFARLDAARFEECFRDWVQAAFQLTGGQVVPVDGQCVRGSHDRFQDLEPLHPDRCLGRGQPAGAGPDRGGQQVLRNHGHPGAAAHAGPEGCIVTLDAMGRWKAIARRIREQGADYLLRVRANHQGLHDRLQDTWDLERAGNFAGYVHDYADTVGKGHGRPRDNYNITAAKLSYNHQLVSMA